MAWISVHEQLKDHQKVRHLSKLLRCSRHEALGVLITLWLWGLNNADRHGDLNGADAEDIADGIIYRALTAETLVQALVESKWLDEAAGHYTLHDWDFWQGEWYKMLDKREANKKRMRETRNDTCATHSATHSAMHSVTHVQASPSPNRHLTVTLPSELPSGNLLPEGNCPHGEIMELFNSVCTSLPKVKGITGTRQDTLRVWWKSGLTMDNLRDFFQTVQDSDFLTGRTGKFTASFDWIIKPANRQKILEGNYANKGVDKHGNSGQVGPAKSKYAAYDVGIS